MKAAKAKSEAATAAPVYLVSDTVTDKYMSTCNWIVVSKIWLTINKPPDGKKSLIFYHKRQT